MNDMHDCPVLGCWTRSAQPFMCRNHWRLVPKDLKASVQASLPGALAEAIRIAGSDRGYRGSQFDPDLARQRGSALRRMGAAA